MYECVCCVLARNYLAHTDLWCFGICCQQQAKSVCVCVSPQTVWICACMCMCEGNWLAHNNFALVAIVNGRQVFVCMWSGALVCAHVRVAETALFVSWSTLKTMLNLWNISTLPLYDLIGWIKISIDNKCVWEWVYLSLPFWIPWPSVARSVMGEFLLRPVPVDNMLFCKERELRLLAGWPFCPGTPTRCSDR